MHVRVVAAMAVGLVCSFASVVACSGESGTLGPEPGAGPSDAAPRSDAAPLSDAASPPEPERPVASDAGGDGGQDGGFGPLPPASWASPLTLTGDVSCLVRDAKLRCWGRSIYDTFGPGAPVGDRTAPWTVSGIAPSVAVMTEDHACAKADGGAYCWGLNASAQLGPVTPACATTSCATPASLGVADIAQLAGDYGSTCARLTTGGVACWGGNDRGSAGRGGGPSKTPSTVAVTDVVDLGVGHQFACALRKDGTVWCWGSNERGTLGRATSASASGTDAAAHPTPEPVAGLSRVVQLAVGDHHSCALRDDGKLTCWGWNGDAGRGGQLGHDPKSDAACEVGVCRIAPTEVPGTGAVARVTAGGWHTCVLRTDGTVACWGWSFRGALGHDPAEDTSSIVPTPKPVTGLAGVTDISLGNAHACALTLAGKVLCWGSNYEGQLGHPDAGPALGSWIPLEPAGL